jgi:transposase
MTAESTNTISFKLFAEMLCTSIKDNQPKPVLMIDNHKAHLNDETKELLNKHFTLVFIPTYSCRFNSIETLWAIIKK